MSQYCKSLKEKHNSMNWGLGKWVRLTSVETSLVSYLQTVTHSFHLPVCFLYRWTKTKKRILFSCFSVFPEPLLAEINKVDRTSKQTYVLLLRMCTWCMHRDTTACYIRRVMDRGQLCAASSSHGGSGNWTQVVRLCSKYHKLTPSKSLLLLFLKLPNIWLLGNKSEFAF